MNTGVASWAAVRVLDVAIEDAGGRLHANLERPTLEESVDGFWLPLVGWVLAADGSPVSIAVSHGRQVLCRVGREVPRADIAAGYPQIERAESSGFSLALPILGLPRELELVLSAEIGGDTVPFARVRAQRRPLEPVTDLALAPLAITTLGRTGSTLLMTLLSNHPAIAAFRPSGFDSRPLTYWLEAATAMATPASRLCLVDTSMSGRGWWLGAEAIGVEACHRVEGPIRDLLLDAAIDRLLHDAIRNGARFAGELAAVDERTAVRYAAEKCWPGIVPRLLDELSADTREIFLVRDFRDVLASMLAFNAKRGFATFGREDVDSDEAFVNRLAIDVEALASSWRERRDRAYLVRYEELISDPEPVLEGLLDYLGLGADEGQVAAIVEGAHALLEETRPEHRTTPDPSASSGRWRSDLPAAIRDASTAVFDGPLREFGYQ